MTLTAIILFGLLGHFIHIILKLRIDYTSHQNGLGSFFKTFFKKESVWIVTSALLIVALAVIWAQTPETENIPVTQSAWGAAIAGYTIDSLLKNILGKTSV